VRENAGAEAVTTLCRIQCDVAEMCTLLSAV